MKTARIVIADDHALVRGGLRELLTAMNGMQVVGEAADSAGILSCLRRTPCDVLVLDIGLPGRDGIEVLRLVKRDWPAVRVLMISGMPEAHFGQRALESGADGFVSKERDLDEVVLAISRVAAGARYVPAALAGVVAESSSETNAMRARLLTDRELATFRRIVAGMRPREIAQDLSISARSVSVYRARILKKLALRTNVDLATYAARHNLFEAPHPAYPADGGTEVLVAEDDSLDAEVVRRAATLLGLPPTGVVYVSDGEQAVRALCGKSAIAGIRLAILDIKMPKLSGLDVLREMRASPLARNIPAVVMSGSDLQRDIDAAYAAGASGYMVKPRQFDQFLQYTELVLRYWLQVVARPSTAPAA